ncbi:DUF2057 family protein [Pseudoalteromonas denitrificans]|uniref:DUF2057 domain-containing protein n=1 Tax=Pseudoalteromonas denitrificans DSM 6059 TaxID=1123010 RepID=A0A1I1PXN9_9GAMM|nr:DUF2057 family protein [Pseudoalteromonas denitrificans]SFD14599.1 hypothetical protein SAMN02745724_03639 [Pseudoalteromonas denitrificans DSM 6059]
MRYFLFFLSFFSCSVFAVQIKFPEELIPLQVDSNKIEHSLFSPVDEIKLTQGMHKIQLKYSDLFELDFDDHEVVESQPFWIKVNISSKSNYRLIFDAPQDVEAAHIFAKAPLVMLEQLLTGDVAIIEKSSEPEVSISEIKPDQVIKEPKVLDMLDFWWKQANEDEKTLFLKSLEK